MEDRTTRFGLDLFRGQPINLWQGTVLESTGGTDSVRKLIVSADCDLTAAKGNTEFFTLDVLRAERYVFQLLTGPLRSDLLTTLLQAVRETATNRSPQFASVSENVLCEWLISAPSERWAIDLPGLHITECEWLSAIRVLANNLLLEAPAFVEDGRDWGKSVLLTCTNEQLLKKTSMLNAKIKDAISKRLNPSRVDLYVFPSFPGESGVLGYVIPFKSLRLMSLDQVCMRRSDLVDNPGGLIPVATCRPMLLQSLLQKMTTYFIRIGLTNNFESEQRSVVKALVESLR